MASLKAEKPVVQLKKEPAAPKASGTMPKAPATKAAPKKAETKPKEPRKKVTLHIYSLINKKNRWYMLVSNGGGGRWNSSDGGDRWTSGSSGGRWNSGGGRGRGRSGRDWERGRAWCSNCKDFGHWTNKCWELHGYPPNHPKSQQRPNHSSYANNVCNYTDDGQPALSLSQVQLEQLMSLLNSQENKSESSSGTKVNMVKQSGSGYEEDDWNG